MNLLHGVLNSLARSVSLLTAKFMSCAIRLWLLNQQSKGL